MPAGRIRHALDVYGVDNQSQLEDKLAAHCRRNRIIITRRDRSVDAYVNVGRWVADCPECGSGIGVQPGVGRATCWECGSDWAVTFPPESDRRQAERLLVRRPVGARNWNAHRGEPVEALQVENDAHAAELLGES